MYYTIRTRFGAHCSMVFVFIKTYEGKKMIIIIPNLLVNGRAGSISIRCTRIRLYYRVPPRRNVIRARVGEFPTLRPAERVYINLSRRRTYPHPEIRTTDREIYVNCNLLRN